MISLLDIVGPVMVGPSSSHTAGACRLSRVALALLEEEPVEARFELHSAFAKTMRGHGTDRALVAGALGMEVDDPRLKDALELAKERGLRYALKPKNMGPEAHPNSVAITLTGPTRTIAILGASIGGGMSSGNDFSRAAWCDFRPSACCVFDSSKPAFNDSWSSLTA